jgi:methylated-DNA-[protein]-cysteine S-methyltransferase
MLHTLTTPSPLGPLRLFATADALIALYLPTTADPGLGHALARALPGTSSMLERAAAQLAEYFAGARLDFTLPLAPEGTPFQQRVWHALTQIPFGQTQSYGALAAAIGKPSASRAVGAANGQNPIAIVLPCHRVIGANGSLTGYGGGLPAKRWLLGHEQQHAGTQRTLFSTT